MTAFEQNETTEAKKISIETTAVGEVPAEFTLPDAQSGNRLVIGAKPSADTEKPESGLEIISLADFPKDAQGNTLYNGSLLQAGVEAILVDPLVIPDFDKGIGYKGLRKGESIAGAKLTSRFGKEVGFTVAMDAEGKLMIENAQPGTKLDVLEISSKKQEVITEESAADTARRMMGFESTDDSSEDDDPDRTHTREEVEAEIAAAKAFESKSDEALSNKSEHEIEVAEDIGEVAVEAADIELASESEPERASEPQSDVLEGQTHIEELIALKAEETRTAESDTEAADKTPKKPELSEEEIAEQLEQMKQEYARRVDAVLDVGVEEATRGISRVSDNLEDMSRRMSYALRELPSQLEQLQHAVSQADSYGDDVATPMHQIGQISEMLRGTVFVQFAEAARSGDEARRYTVSTKSSVEQTANEVAATEYRFKTAVAEVGEDTDPNEVAAATSVNAAEKSAELTAINDEMDGLATSARRAAEKSDQYQMETRTALSIMDRALDDARYGRINTQDLHAAVSRLQGIVLDAQQSESTSELRDAFDPLRTRLHALVQ